IREADLSRAFSAARARSATPLIWIKLVANDSQRPTTLPDEGSHVLVSGVQQCRFSRLRLWRASCNCMDQTRVFEAIIRGSTHCWQTYANRKKAPRPPSISGRPRDFAGEELLTAARSAGEVSSEATRVLRGCPTMAGPGPSGS